MKKKIDMSTKVAKYFVARRIKGMSRAKAAGQVGIARVNTTNYERMPTFKALEEKYADKLLRKIGLDEAADEHIKIIKQDRDLGAKLNALKFYAERVEPEAKESRDDDQMLVVLKA